MSKTYNILIILSILLIGCSKKEANVTEDSDLVKKKRIEINASKRAGEGGNILSALGKKNNTYDFSTSNPMWRAAINAFESIPLNTVDYSGGVIITDWYSNGTNENIKINVNFLSDELKASSIKVSSFKKICKTITKCAVEKLPNNFDNQIKENIISRAIALNVKSQSKKN